MSKLWPVYCVPGMHIYLLSTRQILQSRLRVKAVLIFVISLVILFYWLLLIVKNCILKHNIPNPVSLAIKHLDFETLHHYFEHVSDKVICHVLNNDDAKKIHFPI